MRWFQLLLISLVVLGQVFPCDGSYKLPNGQVCPSCATTACSSFSKSSRPVEPEASHGSGLITRKHGDCHDCCIKTCDDDSAKSPVVASAWVSLDLVACLPPKVEISIPWDVPVGTKTIHVTSGPITGPPSPKSSRAPPLAMNSLPSAGRRFVIA